jgi:hypothetical protein
VLQTFSQLLLLNVELSLRMELQSFSCMSRPQFYKQDGHSKLVLDPDAVLVLDLDVVLVSVDEALVLDLDAVLVSVDEALVLVLVLDPDEAPVLDPDVALVSVDEALVLVPVLDLDAVLVLVDEALVLVPVSDLDAALVLVDEALLDEADLVSVHVALSDRPVLVDEVYLLSQPQLFYSHQSLICDHNRKRVHSAQFLDDNMCLAQFLFGKLWWLFLCLMQTNLQ